MRIDHNSALKLERIARKVFSSDRGGMGGFVDAGHFEREPFDAALIAIAPLWENGDSQEIGDFLCKWEYALREESDEPICIEDYIEELKELVTRLRDVNEGQLEK